MAVAQTVPVRGDVDANLAQHVELVRLAAGEHPDVLVFPELSLTGYELDLAEALAFSERDERLSVLQSAAASSSTTLVVGAPVRIGTRLHIGAFVLAPDGAIALYTKHHLGAFSSGAARDGIVPPAEATVFQPGELDPLIRFDGHTAAVAVCADAGHPSHPTHAAERGASTYLASMFVIPSDFEAETTNLRRCAVRHGMAVAFANFGGPSGGLASAGRSVIWSPRGERLVELEPAGCGVAMAFESESGWQARLL
ncbi:MAG TPA: carbon-nitrogen hydrolase family protein [Vicinamibacterales bacterium]|jgi:predicted amidohydrolase